MKIAAIIAEYNPFHSGHAYHIKETKRLTHCDALIVLMSGNYVQRGEISIFNKMLRAKQAIFAGADLVLEIPSPFVLQSASVFAAQSLKILSSIPDFQILSFGSSLPIEKLQNILNFEQQYNIQENTLKNIHSGFAYPKAYSEAMQQINNKIHLISNDLLAIEYMRWINKLNLDCKCLAIQRVGTSHDEMSINPKYLSGKKLRTLLKNNDKKALKYLNSNYPKNLFNQVVRVNKTKLNDLLTYKLFFNAENKNILHYENGMNNLLKKNRDESIDYWINSCTNKRYTKSRIKRYILSLLIEIESIVNQENHLPVLRPLAMTSTGQSILKTISKTEVLYPVNGKILSSLQHYPVIQSMIQAEVFLSLVTNQFHPSKIFSETPWIKKD